MLFSQIFSVGSWNPDLPFMIISKPIVCKYRRTTARGINYFPSERIGFGFIVTFAEYALKFKRIVISASISFFIFIGFRIYKNRLSKLKITILLYLSMILFLQQPVDDSSLNKKDSLKSYLSESFQ